MVKLLLTRRDIEINATSTDGEEKTALHEAVEKENLDILVQLLISRQDIDINAKLIETEETEEERKVVKEKTALYIAVEKGNVKIVQLLLLQKNIDVNAKSMYLDDFNSKVEKTALHIAVQKESVDIIELLLNHDGINKNETDEQGRRPVELTDKNEIKCLFS